MRKIPAALLFGVALTLLLAGCGGTSHPKAKVTPSPTPTVSKSQKFLDAVTGTTFDSWVDARPTDTELLDFPPRWCAAVKAGHSVSWILGSVDAPDDLYPVGELWGTTIEDAGQLLVLGVTAYCPKYRSSVTAELRDAGQY